MRELEFLPRWYTVLRRRRHVVRMQLWLTACILGTLLCWLGLANRNCRAAQSTAHLIDDQVAQTRKQLVDHDRLVRQQVQLKQQLEVQSKLGRHVEVARLIATLSQIMPANMSLRSLDYGIEETPQAMGAMARAALKDPANPPMDRFLRVQLTGVAPTDVDLASFITELNRVPYFDRVAMTYARDHKEQGRLMREFVLTFSVNLNLTAEP